MHSHLLGLCQAVERVAFCPRFIVLFAGRADLVPLCRHLLAVVVYHFRVPERLKLEDRVDELPLPLKWRLTTLH